MNKIKICHITTVHPRFDVRIFHKECKSLSEEFEDVNLIVADGNGDELIDGIKFIDIGKPTGRKDRFLNTSKLAYQKAISVNADVYHLHDPELLRIAKKLKKEGAKVIYDAHEDLPRQVLSKPYIPRLFRPLISYIVERFENKNSSKLDGIVTATPHIRDRFLKINKNTIDVNNFPKTDDIVFNDNWSNRENAITYIGGIFKTRGIFETLDTIKDSDVILYLAGNFSPASLEQECKDHPGWNNVKYLGFLDRSEINELLSKVKLGMVILEATPSYLVSLPVKMFEYMAAGLPVVASDFPYWKEIINECQSGIFVNQTKPEEIRQKILEILYDNSKLEEMGKMGRKSIESKYNWEIESNKLIALYKEL